MTVPVGFHPEAIEESVAAERWYRERSSAAAEAFVAEIDRAVELIGEAPERWARHVRGTRRFVLRRFPFTIIFRAAPTGAEIIAIAHGRRRPGYWKHR
jgi:toxin ParE1/3/4